MQARIKETGEIKCFYPTTQSGYAGYVDKEGKFYYPSELDFRNGGILMTSSREPIRTPEEARECMITTLEKVISGLERNREILKAGGRLENEHWTDIARTFRETMELFGNQDKFLGDHGS